jgi:5-methylthioadenosine/S-adenosylhomocysteine deaminase
VNPAATESVELLIEARWVIPVHPAGLALADHSVAVRDGRIVALLPTAEARQALRPQQTVQLDTHVLLPGLVNTHTHAAMSLFRGYADDMPLMRWLQEKIWPAEMEHVSEDFVYDGTRLACAEMLLGGITCANEMYFFPGAAARAFLESGLRASVGIIALEFPSRYASSADDYLARGLAVRDRFRDEPSLGFCLAPHAPYTVSNRTFERIAGLAEELDLPVHLHVHETAEEIRQSLAEHGVRPLERLRQLGLVSPRLIAVHAVHLEEAEIDLLSREGASAVHCPSSNLKLASGLARMERLRSRGVNVALGTDGAASNNRLDLLGEMRLAALLAKGVSGSPEALPAHAAIAAATLNGARALGLEAQIGSIEAGKAADLVAVDLGTLPLAPCYDPASHLVYAAERSNVTEVWVGGIHRVSGGRLAGDVFEGLESKVCMWQNRLV